MSWDIQVFGDSQAEPWDDWCAASVNATLLHTRRFLSYHQERFTDRSVLLRHEGRLVGVLPAAEHRQDREMVISHPGATYGGIVHDGWLTGGRMIEALQAVAAHYRETGARVLRYKPTPHIYALRPAQDDLYALWRIGARLHRCDLACTIDLESPGRRSERRARSLKKARAHGLEVHDGLAPLEAFWDILADNLRRKHDASPVHTLAELRLLAERFPRHIRLVTASAEGRTVSGTLLFTGQRVWHAQYIASSDTGYQLHGLDLVFDTAIGLACDAGARYFDFGTSNENEGQVLNDSLYRFKAEFGASGVAYQHLDIDLT